MDIANKGGKEKKRLVGRLQDYTGLNPRLAVLIREKLVKQRRQDTTLNGFKERIVSGKFRLQEYILKNTKKVYEEVEPIAGEKIHVVWP